MRPCAPPPAFLPLACLLLALAGCAAAEPRRPAPPLRPAPRPAQRPALPPTPRHVRDAVRDLGRGIEEAFPQGFPAHLHHSLEFPRLPLARLQPLRDEGGTGAELGLLDRALEDALRRQGYLRLAVDEAAVPPSLRREPDREPGRAGLTLEGAIDARGRVILRLQDTVSDRLLLEGRSR